MKDKNNTGEQLIDKLLESLQQVSDFEKAEGQHGKAQNEIHSLVSSILDSIPHAVIGLKGRRIIFANHGITSVFGWQPEELIGKDTKILYRSDKEYEEIASYFYPALETRRKHQQEFPCRHKDGRDIMCMISTSRIGKSLRDKMIVATYVDITRMKKKGDRIQKANENLETWVHKRTLELKKTNEKLKHEIIECKRYEKALVESEEQLAQIINFLPDATFAIDLEGNVIAWNRSIEEMTGVKAEDMLGKGNYEYALPFYEKRQPVLVDLVIHPDEEKEKDYFIIRKEQDVLIVETDVPFVKGKNLFLWGKASPLCDRKGRVIGAIESIRDITDRKLAKEALHKYRDKLEDLVTERTEKLVTANKQLQLEIEERKRAEEQVQASLREKEVLLRELYHRTKNNIQVICGLFKLQSVYLKDKQVLQIFKETEDRIKSMSIVHEKLYQSQNLSQIDLKDYIENLAEGLIKSYNIKNKKISLRLLGDHIPVTIDTATPCGLIINELISNSLKYAFPGNREGEISISLQSSNNGGIELRVGDNGIGISKGINFKNATTLGLQLVTNLIEKQLHGTIKLSTDKGTEFQLSFEEIQALERI